MPQQNDFLPFAIASGANVESQADYAGSTERQTGYQAGTARSPKINKALRQATALAAVLGLLTTTRGPLNAVDDGNIAALETAFATAVAQLVSSCGYAVDTGQINSLQIALTPNPTTYYDGLTIKFVPQSTNTGQCTITVNSIGGRPLLRRDGTAVQAKDLGQGNPYIATYVGGFANGAFRLVAPAQSEVPRVVSNPVLYVLPTGSDSNDGSAASPAKAFATIGAALAYGTTQIAYFGTQLQIVLAAPGTYAAPQTSGSINTQQNLLGSVGSVQIVGGDGQNNQDAYIIGGSGFSNNTGILHASFSTSLTLRNVTVNNGNPNAFNTVTISSNATAFFQNVTFTGNAGSTGNFAHIYAPDGGQVRVGSGCKITSSMPAFARTLGGGITFVGNTVLSGTLTFNQAFVIAEGNGRITVPVGIGAGFDISGATVTGQRYRAVFSGTIQVFGAGANVFPGSIAGAVSDGGVYG